jgi:hypothetical protein
MLVDGGGGLPGPDRCPGQARGQLGALGPEHLGGECWALGEGRGECWALGEGLGVVGGLGLVCLVAVDGGLVVGPLAIAVLGAAGGVQRNRNLPDDQVKLVPVLGVLPPGTPVAFEGRPTAGLGWWSCWRSWSWSRTWSIPAAARRSPPPG